ncbi:MAG: TrkA family potassium uptake protein [Planctomycetales bacterium]|nr:TrkA family potassium uptake protein [Planctomycetales bacterium]
MPRCIGGAMPHVMQGHIVICGWSETARGVIEQLHSDDGDPRRQIVLIDPHLDHCPIDDPYVYYIKGDATLDETLRRADVATAETAIVLTDWSLADPGLRDAKTTLITLAIENHNRDVYTVVELMRSENRRHLERVDVDEPICVSDLSQRLLVHAALNHGLSRFFASILEFGEGSEIYKAKAPAALVGKTFRQAVALVSDQFEGIVLAVDRGGEIHCNPQGSFTLAAGDELFLLSEEFPHALVDYKG